MIRGVFAFSARLTTEVALSCILQTEKSFAGISDIIRIRAVLRTVSNTTNSIGQSPFFVRTCQAITITLLALFIRTPSRTIGRATSTPFCWIRTHRHITVVPNPVRYTWCGCTLSCLSITQFTWASHGARFVAVPLVVCKGSPFLGYATSCALSVDITSSVFAVGTFLITPDAIKSWLAVATSA